MKKHKCNCDQSYCPLEWEGQEIPFDHPDSNCNFDPSVKVAVSTRASIAEFDHDTRVKALALLYREAIKHKGLDYLQVFKDKDGRILFAIEDAQAITLLLPEDY